LGCGGAAYRSEASDLDTAVRPWDVRDELVRDEARQRYFYGAPDVPQQPSQRAERAWLVGSLHVRAAGHLEEQNEADCAAADRAGELNPDTDRWFAAAENETLGYGGRAGPAPPEFYARGGPERVLARPKSLSVDDKLGAGWPDGSDLGSEPPEPESQVEPELRAPKANMAELMSAGSSMAALGCFTMGCPGHLSGAWRRAARPSAASEAAKARSGGTTAAATSAAASYPPATTAAQAGLGGTAWPRAGERMRALATRPMRTAPPPTTTAGDPATVRAELLRWAAEIGFGGGLDGEDDPLVADGESELALRLRGDVRARANETLDLGRLRTALGWAREFKEDTRREPLLKPLRWEGDLQAMRYNQATFDSLAEYIRQRGSKRRGGQPGAVVSSDTISSYVGVLRLLSGKEAGYAVTGKVVNVTAPAALKRMRQVDGPPGERTLQRGMRAAMMRKLAAQGFDRSSARGLVNWAAALLAHNLLLRGGELGVVDGKPLDTARDLTLGAVEFMQPNEESDGMPWMTVDVVAIKDLVARHRSVPLPVRRRQIGGALGDDPLCTYDAVVLLMRQRLGRMPPSVGRVEGAAALTALFTRGSRHNPARGTWRTSDTNKLAQEMAAALGLDETEFGGKSFRIGGATDLAAAYGVVKAERLIGQRGRWKSDVQRLYERALASEHLGASAAIGEAEGRELEALCRGWVQRSTFR